MIEAGVVIGQARSAAELTAAMGADHPPTPEQQSIIEAPAAPMLVVAGAGSGKTETLSMRIVYLLDNAKTLFGTAISPDEILCLTFTRKASAEITERARARISAVWDRGDDGRRTVPDPHRPEPMVSTYNAYAAALVGEHGLRVGIDPDVTVLTDAALWQLSSRIITGWTGELLTDAAESTLAAAVPAFSAQLRDHAVTPAAVRAWLSTTQDLVASLPRRRGDATPGTLPTTLARPIMKMRTLTAMTELADSFQQHMRRDNVLDFAGQVAAAVELADVPAVRQAERARYRAVLLDEFQDTSPGQLRLFSTLFGADHPVMAVGDPHQAIYGFRGASAQALADFADVFGGEDLSRASLTVSWRNESPVLQAANVIAQPLRDRAPVEVPALTSAAAYLGRRDPVHAYPAVTSRMVRTAEQEAATVVDWLVSRRHERGRRSPAGSDSVTAAVLCRRRSAFAAITDALRAAGVRYEVVGLGGLLDTPAVADVLALLESAHDPSRSDSLMRLLTSSRINLGVQDVAALHDWAEHLAGPRDSREAASSLVDALAQLPPAGWASREERTLSETARARLQSLARVVDAIRRHTYLAVPELIAFSERAWLLDIESALAGTAASGRSTIEAFIDAARTFVSGAQTPTLGSFLAWVEAARHREGGLEAPVKEPDPSAVQVLTVHAAKGLEWDVVAIPGMVDGVFPAVNRSNGEFTDGGWLGKGLSLPWPLRLDHARLPTWHLSQATDMHDLSASLDRFRTASGHHVLEEERRLMYVALTRARSHVLLIGSWYASGVRVRTPSVFMDELLAAGLVDDQHWDPRPTADDEPDDPVQVSAPWPRSPEAAAQPRRRLADLVRQRQAHLGPDADWQGAEVPIAADVQALLSERDEVDPDLVLPAHLSTSALVALRRDRQAFAMDLRRPVPARPGYAADRGSALHAWIEGQYGMTALFDPEDLGPGEDDAADLTMLKETFAASEWARRRPSHVEADVEVAVGTVTIRSRIDAVFPPGDGLERVTVVDWKSGRPPADSQERAAREVQLSMYRLAWSELTGVPLEQVDAAFYYVGADVTVWPQRLWGREQILGLIAGESPPGLGR